MLRKGEGRRRRGVIYSIIGHDQLNRICYFLFGAVVASKDLKFRTYSDFGIVGVSVIFCRVTECLFIVPIGSRNAVRLDHSQARNDEVRLSIS